MADQFEGGCVCGAVRFAATGRPKWAAWSHCQSCRRHSGAPVSVFAAFARAAHVVTKGEITKLGASGRSPTKRLSMVKRPARARGRRLSLQLVWFGSAYRSVLGCAHRGLGGEVERRQGGV